MHIDINLNEISTEALETFPPLDNDNSAASNFAQRLLTKILSEKRKSGQDTTSDAEQELRAALDGKINDMSVAPEEQEETNAPSPTSQIPTNPQAPAPQIEILEAIIADCFHTSTDGSKAHLDHLQNLAIKKANQYLRTTNAGFMAKLRWRGRTRKMIRRHRDEARPTNH